LATLFVAQVCGSTGHAIGLAVGSIMAASITGTNTWSGVPIAVGALGTALASWPLARLMARPLYLHDQGGARGRGHRAPGLPAPGRHVRGLAAVGLAGLAPGVAAVPVILALFLNGVGWNLAFVAGSALLTDALAPAERAAVQGFADLLMGLMGAIGSAAGGMILGLWGFAILNAVGAALALGPLAVTLRRRPAPASLSSPS
jgi:MFS family permease